MTAWGMAIVHHTKNVWEKRVSRIVIGSGVEGSFSLAVRRRVFEKEKWETPYRGKVDGASRKRLSEGGGKKGTKKISRCARNDSVGDGYPVHHTKNVWEKARFSYRHPERSRGIFFVGGKTERARWRETGNTVSRKGGTVLPADGLAKESWEKGDEKDFSLRSK